MPAQFACRDWAGVCRQRVAGRNYENQLATPDLAATDAAARGHVAGGADDQIGAAGGQGIPTAAEYFGSQADAGAAGGVVEAFE